MPILITCVQTGPRKNNAKLFVSIFFLWQHIQWLIVFTKVSDLSQEFVKSAFHTAEPNLQVE